jgi:hypothetical protein
LFIRRDWRSGVNYFVASCTIVIIGLGACGMIFN